MAAFKAVGRILPRLRPQLGSRMALRPLTNTAGALKTAPPKLDTKLEAKRRHRDAVKRRDEELSSKYAAYTLPPAADLRLVYMSTEVDKYLAGVKASGDPITAFDMEWNMARKDQPERRTGLVQIAHQSCGVLLFTVGRQESQKLPQSMLDYISDKSIIKLGVNISQDFKKLQRDFPTSVPDPEGVLELSALARHVDAEIWTETHPILALQKLAAFYLERHLEKGDVRRSDWEGFNLSPQQLQYAAGDVLSSLAIYKEVMKRASSKNMTIESGKLVETAIPSKPGFTQRQAEAWALARRHNFNFTEVGTKMGILPKSALAHILNAIAVAPEEVNLLTPEETLAFRKAVVIGSTFKNYVAVTRLLDNRLSAFKGAGNE